MKYKGIYQYETRKEFEDAVDAKFNSAMAKFDDVFMKGSMVYAFAVFSLIGTKNMEISNQPIDFKKSPFNLEAVIFEDKKRKRFENNEELFDDAAFPILEKYAHNIKQKNPIYAQHHPHNKYNRKILPSRIKKNQHAWDNQTLSK